MQLIRTLIGSIGILFFVGCAATMTAQFAGVAALTWRGMLTGDKVVRYAGVLYGVDPLTMSPSTGETPDDSAPARTPEELLADRIRNTPQIKDRQAVIRKGTDDIRAVVLGLKFRRERQAENRTRFEAYLDQLEAENAATALREIQVTLETLPAKQAKDIIVFMLDSPPVGPDDHAMADVVTVIKAMPPEKMKKIFGEFKSNNERELLHRVLVEIGNLDGGSQLTGTQP